MPLSLNLLDLAETDLTTKIAVEMKSVLLVLFFTLGGISALQCDVPGECVGELIGFTSQNSSTECLATCKGTYFVEM